MDAVRRKNNKLRKGHLYERRPLQTVRLHPPDFKVPANLLLESYIEKEIQFAGVLDPVSSELDVSSRTEVLKVIDQGKRRNQILYRCSLEDDAILSISSHNVKIMQRDGEEKLLLRLAIAQISSLCYIQDDNISIVAIKFAENVTLPDTTQLAVLYCDNKLSAEEICCIIQQCFQLVYAAAAVQLLDSNVDEGARELSIISHTSSDSPAFLTQSTSDLTSHSNDEQLIHQYMMTLYHQLQPEELRQFSTLIKRWHNDLTTREFCDQVLTLYGLHRKHLLVGMRPFIPDKDSSYFSVFLTRLGLPTPSSPMSTRSSSLSAN